VLTVAVMLPASGWLADKIGVRNIFFTAIVPPGCRRVKKRCPHQRIQFM
jgi:MFS family permease